MEKIEQSTQEPIANEPLEKSLDQSLGQSLVKKTDRNNNIDKEQFKLEASKKDKTNSEIKDGKNITKISNELNKLYSTIEESSNVSPERKKGEKDKNEDEDEDEKVEPDPEVEKYLPNNAREYIESCEKLSMVRSLLKTVEDQLTSGREKLRESYIKSEDLLARKIEKFERGARREKEYYLNSPKFYEDELEKGRKRLKTIEEGVKEDSDKKVEEIEGVNSKKNRLIGLREKPRENKETSKQEDVDRLEKQIAWRQSKSDRLRETMDCLEVKKKWAERRETISNLPIIKQVRSLWRGIKYVSDEYPLTTTMGTLSVGGGLLVVGGPLALITASPLIARVLYGSLRESYRREKEGERAGSRWVESLERTIVGPGKEEAMRLYQKRLIRKNKEQGLEKKPSKIESFLASKFEQFKEKVPPIMKESVINRKEFSPKEEIKKIKNVVKTRGEMLRFQKEFLELSEENIPDDKKRKIEEKAYKIWQEKGGMEKQSNDNTNKDWNDAIVACKKEIENKFNSAKTSLCSLLEINEGDLNWNIYEAESRIEAIKKITKKRKENTKEYKKKLVGQQRALAECRNYIQKEIEDNNDVDDKVLAQWIDGFATDYGFTEKDLGEFRKHIETYRKKRKDASALLEQYKNDKRGLIRKLFKKNTEEKISGQEMEKINISVDRMAILINVDLNIMNKLRSNEDESVNKQNENKSSGFHVSVNGFSVIVLGKDLILPHERQHEINSIFSEQFNGYEEKLKNKGKDLISLDEKNDKEKILKDYLWVAQEWALGKVKNELLSTLAGFNNVENGLNFLSGEIEKTPRWEKMFFEYSGYNYFDKYKISSTDAYKKAQEINNETYEEILGKDYKKNIENAIKALRHLNKKYNDPKEIISLLTYQDLKNWPGVARREIEEKNK